MIGPHTYDRIVERTGVSTATVSRVKDTWSMAVMAINFLDQLEGGGSSFRPRRIVPPPGLPLIFPAGILGFLY